MAKEISISEFKDKCLKLMEDLSKDNKDFIITKRGKAIAKVIPIKEEEEINFFGLLKGKAVIKGDIVNSLNEEWDAESK